MKRKMVAVLLSGILAASSLTCVQADNQSIDTTDSKASRALKVYKDEETIKKVKQRLNALGYDSGLEDGIIGGKTVNAIIQFQKDNNLAVSGNINEQVVEALGIQGTVNESNEASSVGVPISEFVSKYNYMADGLSDITKVEQITEESVKTGKIVKGNNTVIELKVNSSDKVYEMKITTESGEKSATYELLTLIGAFDDSAVEALDTLTILNKALNSESSNDKINYKKTDEGTKIVLEGTYISDSEETSGNTQSNQEIPVTFKTTQWTEDVEVPKNSLGYTKYYYEITASDKEHNYFVIDEKGIIVPLINGYGIRYIASSDTDFPSVNDIKGYLPVVSLEDCDADISLNNINVENSEMSGEQKYNLSGSITTSGDSAYIVLIRIFDVDTNETLKDGYKYYIVNDGYASVEEVIARGIDEDKRNLSMEIAGVCPVASVNGSDFTFSKINYAEEVWNDDKSVEATAQMSTTTLDNALVLYKTECNTDGKIVSNTYSTLLENGTAKVKEADYFVPLLGSMTASFEAIAAAKLYDVGTVYPETEEITANEEKEDADVVLEDKETVLSVQEALNKLGYSCGRADGILGANTKNSIIAFQKDNGLNPTGEITSGLLKQLKNESAQAPVYFGNMTPDYFNQRFLNNLNKITGGYTVSDEKMRNGYSTYDFSNSTLGTTYILMYETDSNGKISRVACVPQQFDSSYTDVMKNMITAADEEMDDYSAYTLAAKVVEEDTWNNKLFYSMDREDGILYIETVK